MPAGLSVVTKQNARNAALVYPTLFFEMVLISRSDAVTVCFFARSRNDRFCSMLEEMNKMNELVEGLRAEKKELVARIDQDGATRSRRSQTR